MAPDHLPIGSILSQRIDEALAFDDVLIVPGTPRCSPAM